MLTDEYKDSVSSTVKRLGVKARAAGIHLFFAAQRPDKDVLPPQLRDNLGNRLILRVEGEGTSEIALGQKGANDYWERVIVQRDYRTRATSFMFKCRGLAAATRRSSLRPSKLAIAPRPS